MSLESKIADLRAALDASDKADKRALARFRKRRLERRSNAAWKRLRAALRSNSR